MSDERHYSEEEIATIFEQAVEGQELAQRSMLKPSGLTIDELKKIGSELGITEEFIVAAATKIDHPTAQVATDASTLGIPYELERITELPRSLTDDEWDRLVVDLRETFKAKGKIEQSGSLRHWSNGNLQVHVEPSNDGFRLRMRSLKTSAKGTANFSVFLALTGVFFLIATLASETLSDVTPAFFFPIVILLLAAVAYGHTRVTVPKWHRLRSDQMSELSARVRAATESGSSKEIEVTRDGPSIDLDAAEGYEADSTLTSRDDRTRE